MDIPAFQQLLTPEGQDALREAAARHPRKVDFLRDFTALSKQFPRELARTALEIAILRGEAAPKFGELAQKLYFTRPSLEQATPWEVSQYRSVRYQAFERVLDLGCSIGGDSLTFAQHTPVVGMDRDNLRLQMARANLKALQPANPADFIQADLTSPLPFSPNPQTAIFFDPARRVDGRRIFSVHKYQPPLDIIQNWLPNWPGIGVKISPGVKLDELASYDAEIEFISLKGDLKEAVLWFGPLRSVARRATVLPGPHHLTETDFPASEAISPPQNYLYEPDPAIIRSGLVTTLAAQLNAARLDPTIAYLTGENFVITPFARSWKILDWMPFQLKRLRAYLRARNVGNITVKKRGSPLQPEQLIRDLRPKGDEARIVVLTQMEGKPIVLICAGRGEAFG